MTPTAIIPRSAWVDPKMPVVGPAMPITAIDTITPHYTAAVQLPDGDPGEGGTDLNAIAAYLRAVHRDYTVNRGYSIGYNFSIDWLGRIWELRGFSIKCAANLDHNGHVIAVLFLVDGNDPATPEAAAAFRSLNREARQRVGRKLRVIDHGRLQFPNHPTSCAGTGIRAQVDAGLFNDEYDQPPPPQPPEEDDMTNTKQVRVDGDAAIFTVCGLTATWVRSGDTLNAAESAGFVTAGDPQLIGRQALGVLELRGPLPDYSTVPADAWPSRTCSADFAKHTP